MNLTIATLLMALMAIIVIALVMFQHWRWFEPGKGKTGSPDA